MKKKLKMKNSLSSRELFTNKALIEKFEIDWLL